MWADYFPHARITGVDIDPMCKMYSGGRIDVKIGSQTDPAFLSQFTDYDIIIDDGGHTMTQQKVSFDVLFPLLKPGGIYVIEDLHTSYWPEFLDAPVTMMDFLSTLPHAVNTEASKHERAKSRPPVEDRQIDEIHFYPSMCFIHKTKDSTVSVLEKDKREIDGFAYKVHRFVHKLRSFFRR